MASPRAARTTSMNDDLERFRELAAEFLSYGAAAVKKLVEAGGWIKVDCDD